MREATFEHADNETCLNQVKEVYEQSRIGQTLRHYYYKLLSSGAPGCSLSLAEQLRYLQEMTA